MAGLIAAIDLKRKMYVEFEDAPFHMLEVEISRPTAKVGEPKMPKARAVSVSASRTALIGSLAARSKTRPGA